MTAELNNISPGNEIRSRGELGDYVRLARLDHMTKHVFIIPGIILAYVLRRPSGQWHQADLTNIVIGFASAIFIASANYVINEWLDREFDAFHPLKSQRTAVRRTLSAPLVYAEYFFLAALGLILAHQVGGIFLPAAASLLVAGLIYNVRPIRSKDRPFLDVLSESLNNPIRLVLGWAMIDPWSMPPSSLLFCYWMSGAFLMACKRLSEYRDIAADGDLDMLWRYRQSFKHYSNEILTVSCFLYAMMAVFFLAIFLIKYRIEYILAFPFIAFLFATYFWLSFIPASVVQRPERLFRSRRLMLAVFASITALLVTSFVDIPRLARFTEPHLIFYPQ